MSLKYLFLGDTHGDLDFAQEAIKLATDEDIIDIIQVGDWGYFLGREPDYSTALNQMLERNGVTMTFVDGNHDDHTRLRNYTEAHSLAGGTQPGGGVLIKSNLVYQPRGSWFEDLEGTRFLFCGGAPSIDKANQMMKHTWWAEETIADEEYQTALDASGPFDVLVTHDAPKFPQDYGPKGTLQHQALNHRSMEMVAGLIEKHRPPLHVHGHWHERYTIDNGVGVTEGLASNFDRLYEATMIWSKS